MPWRGAAYPGELPTLGYDVLDWIERYLIVPDGPAAGAPLRFYDEQAAFILRYYAIDPLFDGPIVHGNTFRNARMVRRAIFSRPKGFGKSPMLAAMLLVEAIGDVVFDGWDADGEPVGRPWNTLGFKPKTQLTAAAEDQTTNTWDPLLEMARGGNIADDYWIDVMETFVLVERGKIDYTTTSANAREGYRPVFAALDQTESWTPGNGGVRVAAAVRRNLSKTQGSSVEAPNAYKAGIESVSEKSYRAAALQMEGRLRGADGGILLDHREMPAETDPADPVSLRAGLLVAYGDSASENGGHVNLDRQIEEYYDPDTDPSDARQYYGNQVSTGGDRWLESPEWTRIKRVDRGNATSIASTPRPPRPIGTVDSREPITLGFDGSRGRNKVGTRSDGSQVHRGTTDATALIGCRVRDGHLFQIAVWEQPPNHPRDKPWRIPVEEVLTTVDDTFQRYNVVGMYADPAKWESHVGTWEAKYGPNLLVKSTAANPIEWWMTGGRGTATVRALKSFRDAILLAEVVDGRVRADISHDGSSELTRHALAAYERATTQGIQIAKEHPDSSRKIDAVVAAVLAYQARLDAIAAGVLTPAPSDFFVPRNLNPAADGRRRMTNNR